MIKCCICGREIISSDPYVLFESASGRDMYGCEACEKQMNTLMEGENPAEVKEAVNYFYTYAEKTEDDEVKGFLENIVESNAAAVDKLSAVHEEKKLIEQRRRTLLDHFVIIGIIVLIIAGINSFLDNLFVSIILGLVAFVFCVCMFWIAIFKIMGISIFGERRKKRNKQKHP